MPCDMGCCRGEASKCEQCLVAHVLPFSWVFQGLSDKIAIENLSWWHKFLADDSLTVKKEKTGIDLILDFLILALLGQGEFSVCHSRLWRFVSGSYSKIHDSSPVIRRLKNSGTLSRRSRRSRNTSLQLTFCKVVRFFGTILAKSFLMSKSYVKIWWTLNRLKI